MDTVNKRNVRRQGLSYLPSGNAPPPTTLAGLSAHYVERRSHLRTPSPSPVVLLTKLFVKDQETRLSLLFIIATSTSNGEQYHVSVSLRVT